MVTSVIGGIWSQDDVTSEGVWSQHVAALVMGGVGSLEMAASRGGGVES